MESKRYWQWLLMRFAERHVIEGAISLIVVLMTRVPETLKSVLARIWMLVSIIVALIAALFLIRLLSSYRWAGFADKTLWDWLKLLFIPFVLALGAYLLNQAGRLRDQAIEKQREQDAAVRTYLEKIGQLLIETKIQISRPAQLLDDGRLRRAESDDNARALAQAWTFFLMETLDGARKKNILRFLFRARLINEEDSVLSLSRMNLKEIDWRNLVIPSMINMSGTNMERAKLVGANLTDIDLSGANLQNADMRSATLSSPALRNAVMIEANLRGVTLLNPDLSGANLEWANLRKATLVKPNVREATMTWTNLRGATLESPDLRNTNMHAINLRRTILESANLRGMEATLADLRRVQLHGADMREVNCKWMNLRRAQLKDANLTKAILQFSDLRDADLSGADLSGAALSGSYLHRADLSGSTLQGATLESVDLSDANLTDANLTDANLTDAIVSAEQLDTCKSLEDVTMPNSQKYEDWLRAKEGGEEDGESTGPP